MAVEPGQALAIELPVSVVTQADVGRLVREAEAVDNLLRQAALKQPDAVLKLPKTSHLYDEIVATNKLNILLEEDRRSLYNSLQKVHKESPVLHMSFGADPSAIFLQKLVSWIRQHIHPAALLQIGLVPNIGAGCVVRTNNKFFNFSLKQRFIEARPVLIAKLQGAAVPKPRSETVVPAKVPIK